MRWRRINRRVWLTLLTVLVVGGLAAWIFWPMIYREVLQLFVGATAYKILRHRYFPNRKQERTE